LSKFKLLRLTPRSETESVILKGGLNKLAHYAIILQ